MPTPLALNRAYDPAYGTSVRLSPRVLRVLAKNPSPFTFHGTGTYIIEGDGTAAVIDPGPIDMAHLDAIMAALAGRKVSHILITHTHHDHSPLAAELKRLTGASTWGYGPHGSGPHDDGTPAIEEGGDMDFVPDVEVRDGDVIAGAGFTVEALHTPGHTSNHVCFRLRKERALFTGDHVMGWSTTVVGPPDGDMRAYMQNLRRLTETDDAVFYPTHGAPVGGPHDALARSPAAFARSLVRHREEREAQILTTIAAGLATIPEMVAEMYKDVDKRLHPAAGLSVLAHLKSMVAEARVRADGEATARARYSL
jgi:glyoxylase-like metal-dependent hydrolase (beta-lactamase superfamily II)